MSLRFFTRPRSLSGVVTPSRLPNIESSPSSRSTMKKRTDQSCGSGIFMIASAKTMKARPEPPSGCAYGCGWGEISGGGEK